MVEHWANSPFSAQLVRNWCFGMTSGITSRHKRYPLTSGKNQRGYYVPAMWSRLCQFQKTQTDDLAQCTVRGQKAPGRVEDFIQETGAHVPFETRCHRSFPEPNQVSFGPKLNQMSNAGKGLVHRLARPKGTLLVQVQYEPTKRGYVTSWDENVLQ